MGFDVYITAAVPHEATNPKSHCDPAALNPARVLEWRRSLVRSNDILYIRQLPDDEGFEWAWRCGWCTSCDKVVV